MKTTQTIDCSRRAVHLEYIVSFSSELREERAEKLGEAKVSLLEILGWIHKGCCIWPSRDSFLAPEGTDDPGGEIEIQVFLLIQLQKHVRTSMQIKFPPMIILRNG